MWISFRNVAELFRVSTDSVAALREDNAALRTENEHLKAELLSTKVNLDWLRVQYNQAQMERTALMNQHYKLALPTPELAVGGYTTPNPDRIGIPSPGTVGGAFKMPRLEDFNFDDIGDEAAAAEGLPVYGK